MEEGILVTEGTVLQMQLFHDRKNPDVSSNNPILSRFLKFNQTIAHNSFHQKKKKKFHFSTENKA